MRTIKRPAQYEPMVKLLAETNHPSTGKSMFPTLRELLCFASILGFSEGSRRVIEGSTVELDGRVFENSDLALDLIYLIALADHKDAMILHADREDDMLRTFEEYAAEGLSIIDSWLKERADDLYGDQALLTAFRKCGFLKSDQIGASVDPASVTFG